MAVVGGEDPNESGVRRHHHPSFDQRATGKVARVDLDRLLAEDRERARAEEEEQQPRPRVVMRACVLAPLELQDVPRHVSQRPVSSLPPPLPPFAAMRAARDEARRTKRIVVAIWAFALTLAGGLGYFVASQT